MDAIEKYGLSERVCHLGYVEQDDLQAIYRMATALVMPSLFESISIPIYEAFQVGTPVAASNILGIPEQVGDAGLLFDPESVASIREAILKIVRDPASARELGRRGRKQNADDDSVHGAQLQRLLVSCGNRSAAIPMVTRQNSNANSGSRGLLGRSSPGVGYFEDDGDGAEAKNRLCRNVISGALGKLKGAMPPMLLA